MKHHTRWLGPAVVALILVFALLPLQAAFAQETLGEKKDIVETAIAAGDFTTLVAAVEAADLVETLQGEGPFTVFAPTDDAFAALPEGTLDSLLADPEALEQVLTYHVLPGRIIAALISDGGEKATVQGENVKFTFADGEKLVNDAKIVVKDIMASNGVIHVIDKVILPPSMAPASEEAAPTEEPAVDAAAASEATATPEATAEATVEATAEATAEAAATPEAAAAPEATSAEESAAPETLPETGGDNNAMLLMVVAGFALLGMGGLAVATRRRMV